MLLNKNPNNYQLFHNIGYNLKIEDEVDAAIKMYQKALSINPDYEASIYAEALAYLYKGDFETGWKKYAWRLKKEKRNAEKLRSYLKNDDLEGKTILLIPEGGLGDTVQFIRYAQALKKKGAHVVASVQKPLIPLLSRCNYIDKVMASKERSRVAYDDFGSIMSMPAIFESTEETIPRNIPYIFPDETLVERWAKYFQDNDSFKIGLCWQADIKNDESRLPVARRSIPLVALETLTNLPNVEFYSLQKNTGTSELKDLPDHFIVHIFGPDFDNTSGAFMDTAAIMQHLDLVITVDTATAHLAGAMGVPVWVMLPYNTDWRWISKRKDSPWYPSMKIFKQSAPFDWDGIVQEIFEELKTHV